MNRLPAIAITFFLLLSSPPLLACNPGNLYFNPEFEPGQAQLSRNEIVRLADWRADQRNRYPNGGMIFVDVLANQDAEVSHQLAESRLASLLGLLMNFGIPRSDIEEARVLDRDVGLAEVRNPEKRSEALKYLNSATIAIAPRCPHPCCPGPEPISKP